MFRAKNKLIYFGWQCSRIPSAFTFVYPKCSSPFLTFSFTPSSVLPHLRAAEEDQRVTERTLERKQAELSPRDEPRGPKSGTFGSLEAPQRSRRGEKPGEYANGIRFQSDSRLHVCFKKALQQTGKGLWQEYSHGFFCSSATSRRYSTMVPLGPKPTVKFSNSRKKSTLYISVEGCCTSKPSLLWWWKCIQPVLFKCFFSHKVLCKLCALTQFVVQDVKCSSCTWTPDCWTSAVTIGAIIPLWKTDTLRV